MVALSVCVEMYWRDMPVDQRVRRVKELGFTAFEFWGWKDKNMASIRAAQAETGLAVAAFASEPQWAVVERDNDRELLAGFAESAQVAHTLGCPTLIVVPGIALADETWETTRRRVVRKVKAMARIAESEGVTIVLEPLNPIVDHKGAWLTRMSEAADLVQEVGSANVKILCDLYHQQITEGNLIANFALYAPLIGHVHTAGVPGRHELVGGELDYKAIFAAIKNTGYSGYIGLEFKAMKGDDAGLKEALTLL